MSQDTGIHAGHRQRLREQYLTHGLDTLSDVNVLELLLFYAVPRRDTNEIAHRLLQAFGSLVRVFDASKEDLMRLGGLTENAAALVRLTVDVARRCQMDGRQDEILNTTQKCGMYMVPLFYGAVREEAYALALDGKCKVLSCQRLSEGSVSSTGINIRAVVEFALRTRAASVVLAHNHVSGIAVPSREDIDTTHLLIRALDTVDVLLADHIVVADGDFVSMVESGYIRR